MVLLSPAKMGHLGVSARNEIATATVSVSLKSLLFVLYTSYFKTFLPYLCHTGTPVYPVLIIHILYCRLYYGYP